MWRLLSARAGLDMRDLIEAAHSYKSVEKYSNKAKIMEYVVQNIDQYASNPRRSRQVDSIFQKIKYFGESLFCGSGIYLGNYLVTTYFFIKIVYLFNSIAQFFVMNEFLGKQFHELGLDIVRYLTNTYSSESSIESVYFPKVVMCDFRIREFGHPNFSHRYTIQCVLPINLYNQQIFTFLWFWFLILFAANLWALVQWVNRMLPKSRRRYINKRLNMLDHFKQLNQNTSILMKPRGLFGRRKSVSLEAKRQKRKFIENYLKFDGVFILRMISMLTSEIVGTELLHELWKKRAVHKELEYDQPPPDHQLYHFNETKYHYDSGHTHGHVQHVSFHHGEPSMFENDPDEHQNMPESDDNLNDHKPEEDFSPENIAATIMPRRTHQLRAMQQHQSFDMANISSRSRISRNYSADDSYNMQTQSNYVPTMLNTNEPVVRQQPNTKLVFPLQHKLNDSFTPRSLRPKKVSFGTTLVEENFSGIDDVFKDLKFEA